MVQLNELMKDLKVKDEKVTEKDFQDLIEDFKETTMWIINLNIFISKLYFNYIIFSINFLIF